MPRQTISEIQDRILGQFSRDQRDVSTNKERNISLEKQIAEANRIAAETRKFNAKPSYAFIEDENRFSHYVPNNPLNGFNGKSKAEQEKIKAKIKLDKKLKKAEDKNI